VPAWSYGGRGTWIIADTWTTHPYFCLFFHAYFLLQIIRRIRGALEMFSVNDAGGLFAHQTQVSIFK
jgi:hypothetical protein